MSLPEIEAEVAQFKGRAAPQQQQQQQQRRQHEQQQLGQQQGQRQPPPDGEPRHDGPEPPQRRQQGGPAEAAAGAAAPAASAAEERAGGGGADAAASGSGGVGGGGPHERASLVLATTDVCLKALPRDLLPLGLPLLIQFDIPPTKARPSVAAAATVAAAPAPHLGDLQARRPPPLWPTRSRPSPPAAPPTARARAARAPPPPAPPAAQDVFSRRVASVFGASKERRRSVQRAVVIDFIAAGEMPAFRARERFSTAPVLEMPVHVPDVL
jgi:hypothetical protein